MRASAELVVGPSQQIRPGFTVERMVSAAPIAWRATPDAIYWVGTSASPVDDDQIEASVRLRTGADLAVRSTAATIAWAGRGSHHHLSVDLEEGSSLDWQLEPLVATVRCDHEQRAQVRMSAGASLRWREIVVAGRTGEPAGRLLSHLSVDRAGRALLRHDLSTGPESVWASPAVMGSYRVAGTLLTVDPAALNPRASAGEGWTAMPLHAGSVLIVALGPDVPTVAERLATAELINGRG